LTHSYGKQLYLTLNAFARPAEFTYLGAWLEELRPSSIDAYIVADPGVGRLTLAIRRHGAIRVGPGIVRADRVTGRQHEGHEGCDE